MLGLAQKITTFLSPLPQRMHVLRQKIEEIGLKRKKLIAPSRTRWFERIEHKTANVNGDFYSLTSDAILVLLNFRVHYFTGRDI